MAMKYCYNYCLPYFGMYATKNEDHIRQNQYISNILPPENLSKIHNSNFICSQGYTSLNMLVTNERPMSKTRYYVQI